MLGAEERCGAEKSLLAMWLSSCDLCSPAPPPPQPWNGCQPIGDISYHVVVLRVFLKQSENTEKEADLPYSRFR